MDIRTAEIWEDVVTILEEVKKFGLRAAEIKSGPVTIPTDILKSIAIRKFDLCLFFKKY